MDMRAGDYRIYDRHIKPQARARMVAVLHEVRSAGVGLYVVEAYRSPARQLSLWLAGKTPLKYPVYHGSGRAFDCCFVVNGKVTYAVSDHFWKLYGQACMRNGLEWGGNWKGRKCDRPHAQWRGK